jgi:hypothetical protein
MNNDSDKYTDVSVIIIDQSNGINHSCKMKDIAKNSTSSFELKDSLRTAGGQLYKSYTSDTNYLCQCTIKFSAVVNNKDVNISYSTFLYPKRLDE